MWRMEKTENEVDRHDRGKREWGFDGQIKNGQDETKAEI